MSKDLKMAVGLETGVNVTDQEANHEETTLKRENLTII